MTRSTPRQTVRSGPGAPATTRRWNLPGGRPLALGLTLLALGALAGGGWAVHRYASDPSQQPIRMIRVSGEFRHLDRDRIRQVVAGAIDGGFYTADMERIRAAVRRLPWVDQVSIRRVWPDTLVMDVVEQVPFARWGDDALVNPRGEIFPPAGVKPAADLVRLYGPSGSAPQVVAFYRWAQAGLASAGMPIGAVGIDARREWTLRTTDGLQINLGQRDTTRRLIRLVATAAALQADPSRRPERVDLRYEHGFAVRWQATGDDPMTAVSAGGAR